MRGNLTLETLCILLQNYPLPFSYLLRRYLGSRLLVFDFLCVGAYVLLFVAGKPVGRYISSNEINKQQKRIDGMIIAYSFACVVVVVAYCCMLVKVHVYAPNVAVHRGLPKL